METPPQDAPSYAKKIHFAIHRLGNVGGQERSSLEILKRLAARGWDISLTSFELTDWPESLPIRWYRVPAPPLPSQLFKNIWFMLCSYVIQARSQRLKQYPKVAVGTATLRADLRVIQYLHCAFKDLLDSRSIQVPNALSPLHVAYQRVFTYWQAALERYMLPRTDRLIAISHSVAADLKKHIRQPSSRTYVVHHAASNEVTLTPRANKHPVVLLVGALERKGIKTALEALAELPTDDWEFWAVGGGNIEHWQSYADQLGIGKRTKFFGHQPAQPFFARADIFLFPTIYEPFGLVVTEAIEHGLVPIVSRECGAHELFPQTPDWMQLSCHDAPKKWAQALARVLRDEPSRRDLIHQSSKQVSAWDWEQAADQYEAVFTSLTNSGVA